MPRKQASQAAKKAAPAPVPESQPRPGLSTKMLYIMLAALLVLIAGVGITLALLTKQANNVVPSTTATQVPRVSRPQQPGFATDFTSTVPEVRPTDIVFGSADAPVTLYEYGDLECPFCKSLQPTLTQLEDLYQGKLAVVFRHYPLSIHPNAPMESQILACVAADNKQHARDLIILNYQRSQATGTSFTSDQYLDLAAEAGADRAKTATCFQNQAQKAVVDQDIADGHTMGLNLTPTLFLVRKSDGRTLQILGAYSLSDMQIAVQYILP